MDGTSIRASRSAAGGGKKERDNEHFDREIYRRRNVVERCTGCLKECRRVATRYDKLAVSYLAMLRLACIQQYFRMLA